MKWQGVTCSVKPNGSTVVHWFFHLVPTPDVGSSNSGKGESICNGCVGVNGATSAPMSVLRLVLDKGLTPIWNLTSSTWIERCPKSKSNERVI